MVCVCVCVFCFFFVCFWTDATSCMAFIAQLGERQTEDQKVPSSILGEYTHCCIRSLFLEFLGLRSIDGVNPPATLRPFPYSLVGQDTSVSPPRPGFDPGGGNTFWATKRGHSAFCLVQPFTQTTQNECCLAAWPNC